jgi:flagellar hook-associated protein 3 FlgL
MSGITGFGFPSLTLVLAGMNQTRKQFDKLTEQSANGLIADTFAGLGGKAPVVLALSPQVDNLQVTQDNIDAASGPAALTQVAMKQIQSIASNLFAQMPNLTGLNGTGIDVIAANARSDLVQVAALLDSHFGGVYVFAGEDSSNPPVPDPNQIISSGFFTQISTAVGNLSANGTAATVAATLTIAGSNAAGDTPFSTYMSQPVGGISAPSVSTGEGQSQKIGLFASANQSSVSTGTSTTGSYMRDLMRALATVGSLTSSQQNDPNFASLVADTQTSITGAITAMSTDVGILGNQQSSLASRKTTLSDTSAALTIQLSLSRDVDMALTLSNLTLTQTRLQASFQLITTANSMSLVKFLPAG